MKNGLMEPLRERILSGMPVFGTCAGMILLSRDAGLEQPLLGVMDIGVTRNAYGRQKENFESVFPLPFDDDEPFTGVFIRAPRITSMGPGIEILASFHPELNGDDRTDNSS